MTWAPEYDTGTGAWRAAWVEGDAFTRMVTLFGGPRATEADAKAYAVRLAKRYPSGPASMLLAPETRREVVVTHEGDTYRFPNKAKARRSMRALLRVRRLPPSVAAQINGDGTDTDETEE